MLDNISIMTTHILLSIILQRFIVLSVSWAQPLLKTISKMALISLPALCRIKHNVKYVILKFKKIFLEHRRILQNIVSPNTHLCHVDHVSHESEALQFKLRDICLQQHINLRKT